MGGNIGKILLAAAVLGGIALAAGGGDSDREKQIVAEFRELVKAERDGTLPIEEITQRAAALGKELDALGWSLEKKLKLVRDTYKELGMTPPAGPRGMDAAGALIG